MLWVIPGASALVLAGLALVWNRLASLRTAMNAAWADVDVQLQRRHDLVPELTATAQAYLAHERSLLDDLAARRSAALAAGADIPRRDAAETALQASLTQVIARAEAYPELKASGVMLRLQEDLTSTERRVALARQRFNETVRDYNAAIGGLPGALLAPLAGMKTAAMFSAGADAAEVPSAKALT